MLFARCHRYCRFFLPSRSDYQRISQELKERGLKRPPPLPEGDPRRGGMSNPAVPSPQVRTNGTLYSALGV